MNTKLLQDIYWVGCVDWTVRDFHGYRTERGTTYNAYLLLDERPSLIDTVKYPHAQTLLEHVSAFIPLEKIAYIVCNHAEPDHAGALCAVLEACPQATVVCNAKCRATLERYHDTRSWKFHIVATGDAISLGRRTLIFMDTPMVHWPESMFTYVPEDRILFSMDAFGQHYASAHRFDDEEPLEVVMAEAKTYYGNILMLYGRPIARTLEKAKDLAIDIIAPSHGVIWRSHKERILTAYANWVVQKPTTKVLVAWDSMWQSTERMARAIADGALEENVTVRVFNLRESNLTLLAAELLDAAALAAGSSTLNQTMMPAVAAALTYLKGLRPEGKAGFAFGSYGWSRGGAQAVEAALKEMRFEIIRPPLETQYAPDEKTLAECREAGRHLARRAAEIAQSPARNRGTE